MCFYFFRAFDGDYCRQRRNDCDGCRICAAFTFSFVEAFLDGEKSKLLIAQIRQCLTPTPWISWLLVRIEATEED
ncbi:hypothetical protein M513_05867 [Trichuris suis]|uniref:Uncharacterized protein n=1 Tax=Trichuris suis TaxID=68888 RepID=A0A085M7G1_9BILA|nr:hypothetical protein M513_05867 [Trichuris suis]